MFRNYYVAVAIRETNKVLLFVIYVPIEFTFCVFIKKSVQSYFPNMFWYSKNRSKLIVGI